MKKKILFLFPFSFLVLGCNNTTNEYDPNVIDKGTPNTSYSHVSSSESGVERNEVNVIIMMGQSNMEGNTRAFSSDRSSMFLANYCSSVGNSRYDKYMSGYDDVQISYYMHYSDTSCNQSNNEEPISGKFVSTKVGQGLKDDNYFGPELGLAETISESHNSKPTYLVKYAIGNTGFSGSRTWLSPSSGSSGSLYLQALQFIQNSLDILTNQGLDPKIKAFLWMQGENDANSSVYNVYASNLTNLYNDLFTHFLRYCPDYDTNNVAFIDAGINENTEIMTNCKYINQQKVLVSTLRDKNFYIDTNKTGLNLSTGEPGGDQWHYNVGSMLSLGRAYGRVLLDNNLLK